MAANATSRAAVTASRRLRKLWQHRILPRLDRAELRVLSSGVDTLVLSTDRPANANTLQLLEEARSAAATTGEPQAITIGAHALTVEAKGTKTARYLAQSEWLAIAVGTDDQAAAGFPSVTVELRALWLWRAGWRTAAQQAAELVRFVSTFDAPVRVSRVDLCVDFQGWQPTDDQAKTFRCRAKVSELHRVAREVTGWTWGKGMLRARLYEKEREIDEISGKVWMRDVWARDENAAGYVYATCPQDGHLTPSHTRTVAVKDDLRPGLRVQGKDGVWRPARRRTWRGLEEVPAPRTVEICGFCGAEVERHRTWRFELQVRREVLREVQRGEQLPPDEREVEETSCVDTLGGLLDHAGHLFRLLTRRWLSWRLPRTKKKRARPGAEFKKKRRTEWEPLVPLWHALRVRASEGLATDVVAGDVWRAARIVRWHGDTRMVGAYLARAVAQRWAVADASLPDLAEPPTFNAWDDVRQVLEDLKRALDRRQEDFTTLVHRHYRPQARAWEFHRKAREKADAAAKAISG